MGRGLWYVSGVDLSTFKTNSSNIKLNTIVELIFDSFAFIFKITWFILKLNDSDIFSLFADDVGQTLFHEIASQFLKGLTPDDLQHQFEHRLGPDHLETCYIIFNMNQEDV